MEKHRSSNFLLDTLHFLCAKRSLYQSHLALQCRLICIRIMQESEQTILCESFYMRSKYGKYAITLQLSDVILNMLEYLPQTEIRTKILSLSLLQKHKPGTFPFLLSSSLAHTTHDFSSFISTFVPKQQYITPVLRISQL